jgi:23S rRNA pseudouridine2457 synthase
MVGKVSKGSVPPPFLISKFPVRDLKNELQIYKTSGNFFHLCSMQKYYLLYKPYGYLSQFTDDGGHPGLQQILNVEKDVYAVGRLDHDSEGLLLLTNDKRLNNKVLDPAHGHERTYWVQVDGDIAEEALEKLRKGIEIRIDGKGFMTRPSKARKIDEPSLDERPVKVRVRKNIPTSWIEITLTEGKNRQVRKMTAMAGHPALRLVRYAIENLTLEDMKPGQIRSIGREEAYTKLKL